DYYCQVWDNSSNLRVF
nr:immunoglobulin light chain junction region [Macaca mulatta]MOW04134.1 immunoglobulin light chain junction region [Macaca mulatta]MOW04160.1 immunoglobulin light chain junction region [Macaca mulatta]MOW04354.1 immunoglobulin light chain junction region [Macaca mulatta]MOW04571.1 immunoglobulin light chain junction region [Macaca mulatta]